MKKEDVLDDLIKSKSIAVYKDGDVINLVTGRKLGKPNSSGHIIIGLRHEGRTYSMMAHRIVWQVFMGRVPENMQVFHKDRNASNNKLSNLALGTPRSIQARIFERVDRPDMHGDENPNARISATEVARYREEYREGKSTVRSIAKDARLAHETVSAFLTGKTWGHVPDPVKIMTPKERAVIKTALSNFQT